jgi:hypothetical protein
MTTHNQHTGRHIVTCPIGRRNRREMSRRNVRRMGASL